MKLAVSIFVVGLVLSTAAQGQRLQCRSDTQGTRNVAVQGRSMTVVNPKTPNVVFTKQGSVETRGAITKVTTDAWQLFMKDGYGELTNITFGDKYTCIQTGS